MYRQPAGQSTSAPFMSIQDTADCNKTTVLFDNQNVFDTKIDKLTALMGKLTILGENQGRPF